MPTTYYNSTPVLNKLAVEFGKRIGVVPNDPTASPYILVDNDLLTKADYETFLNRAMQTVFNAVVTELQGDPRRVAALFSELVQTVEISFTSGVYTIASPNLHLWEVVRAYKGSVSIAIWGVDKLDLAVAGGDAINVIDAERPVIIATKSSLLCFPTLSNVKIVYVQQPLREDGAVYSSINTEPTTKFDVPFLPMWYTRIIDAAVADYMKQKQEET